MVMRIANISVCLKRTLTFGKRKLNGSDKKEQYQLAAMGWHCITIWECQLKPKIRMQTLESLAYTLNHIFLEDRKVKAYGMPESDDGLMAQNQDFRMRKLKMQNMCNSFPLIVALCLTCLMHK